MFAHRLETSIRVQVDAFGLLHKGAFFMLCISFRHDTSCIYVDATHRDAYNANALKINPCGRAKCAFSWDGSDRLVNFSASKLKVSVQELQLNSNLNSNLDVCGLDAI